MSDWMQGNTVSDVQTAIQSQIIQTALEKNVSDLSPQALQSFLTQAPIPRFYIRNAAAQTFNDNTETSIVWANSNILIDSHRMLDTTISTTNLRIPIDGFYIMTFELNIPVANSDRLSTFYTAIKTVQSGIYAAGTQLGIMNTNVTGSGLGTVTNKAITLTCVRPMQAGDTFNCVALQNVGGAQVGSSNIDQQPTLSVVWIAPYTNYQGGQN